jgi:hypothetical protein
VSVESARRYFALAALVTVVTSCGDGATEPANGRPGITVVAGAGITDTVDAQPVQGLIVEVRDAAGRAVPGALVRFQPRPLSDPVIEASVFVCALTVPMCPASEFVANKTDRAGRAKVAIRMGTVFGKAVILVTVPELGLQDSAVVTVAAGAPAAIFVYPRDTVLDVGGTVTMYGQAMDRYGNARSELATFSAGAGNSVTVDGPSNLGTLVTARDMGTQRVYAHIGDLTDSAVVRVVPAGRLVVWSPGLSTAVRLVNIDGKDAQTLIIDVGSDFGVFPRFDPTRHRITLHSATQSSVGPSSDAIVLDTTGTARRDIIGFSSIIAVRETDDGNAMVVGRRFGDPDGYYVFRVTADNTITLLRTLDGFSGAYGGADIAYDGSRVAYIAGSTLNVLNVSTGAVTNLVNGARSPRWSVQGDRLVYLFPSTCPNAPDGVATVINPDGSGRRVLTNFCFSPGLAWSPDAKYIIGRSSQDWPDVGLRVVRVSDGVDVLTRFDYYQPDWR